MQPPATELKVSAFQLALALLSLLLLIALLVDAVAALPNEVSKILQFLDTAACGIFFLDFCSRLFRSESKLHFMKWGWLDLVACIPNVDLLRVGRLARLIRVIRVLRTFRVGKRLVEVFSQNKPKTAAASALLITLLLIVFASIGILIVERGLDSNIQTAEEAVWWSVTTITTVGYGDKYPTTTEGRGIAILLMLAGVGLFGTLSGIVASFFLGENADEETDAVRERLDQVLTRLKSIESKIGSDGSQELDSKERVGVLYVDTN